MQGEASNHGLFAGFIGSFGSNSICLCQGTIDHGVRVPILAVGTNVVSIKLTAHEAAKMLYQDLPLRVWPSQSSVVYY